MRGLKPTIGQMVLDLPVREQFLRVTLDGRYTHIATGHRPDRPKGASPGRAMEVALGPIGRRFRRKSSHPPHRKDGVYSRA